MDDTINRQAAIDALVWNEDNAGEVAERNQWKQDSAAIKALPSAERRGRWIPVTERLPEESGEYLVTIRSMLYISWFSKDDGVWSFRNADLMAWMPLPEPYKGGEEE